MKFFPILNFDISGPSMHHRWGHGERVWVNKWAYLFKKPGVNDVIVARHPLEKHTLVMKRIIAGPGSHVCLQWGRLFVDGHRVSGSHLTSVFFDETGIRRQQWAVPQEHYFVVGDNPPHSSDSRHFGSIPKKYIIGKIM